MRKAADAEEVIAVVKGKGALPEKENEGIASSAYGVQEIGAG